MTGQIDVRTGQPYPAYKDSSVEWLGKVPAHWDIQRLCQCASIVGGMTPSMNNQAYWNGSIPWVTPKDMKLNAVGSSAIKVTQDALKETSLRLIHTGAVLIVVRGMILARTVPIAWTTCPVTVNQDMKALRPVSGINALYMARALASAQDTLLSFVDVAGHGTRRLPTDRWRALPLPIPPTEEQMAIVSYLDRIGAKCDDWKNSTKREIELLREYRTRLISDVVTGKCWMSERRRQQCRTISARRQTRRRRSRSKKLLRGGRRWRYDPMQDLRCRRTRPEKVSGAWVFYGTRVSVSALFETLRDGATIERFLEWFPGVERHKDENILDQETQGLKDVGDTLTTFGDRTTT